MTPRSPSDLLVVDANILVSAVLGASGNGSLIAVAVRRRLIASAEAERETRRRLSDPKLRDPKHHELIEAAFGTVTVAPEGEYAHLLPDAARTLREAPASANGSEADAHLLAVAWTANADIWSHDRDFTGTGWPIWSTRNLRRALAAG